MRIHHDGNKCMGLGLCEAFAPDVFEVTDDGDMVLLKGDVDDTALELVELAVEGCPTQALHLDH